MGRKCIQVRTLHGFTIEELQLKYEHATSNYARNALLAVIMRYKDIDTEIIMRTIGKSRPTVTAYINNWNEQSVDGTKDHRGGNIPSKLTEELIADIKDVISTKSPTDFGFISCTWNSTILSKYIEQKFGSKFATSWIRKLLEGLGLSYKRGVYKPTKEDPELQEQFKKNGWHFGNN